jgi:hypothetical protein
MRGEAIGASLPMFRWCNARRARGIGGIDGGNGEVEPCGHFGGFPLQHLAQEQNGPLHRRYVLQCHQERQGEMFAAERTVFRISVLIGEQIIGERFQPDRLPQAWRQRTAGIALEGREFDEQAVAALSPYIRHHINRFGHYQLDLTRHSPPIEYDLPIPTKKRQEKLAGQATPTKRKKKPKQKHKKTAARQMKLFSAEENT